MQIDRILFSTDFSPAAAQALHWAQHFAQRHEATLHLLHVVPQYDTDWFGGEKASMSVEQMQDRAEQEAAEGLKQIEPDFERTGIRTKRIIRHSMNPADTILAVASELGADLIVTGTHGREGLAQLILGSVAEKVVRRAPCPVLTVGAAAPDQPDIRRVLAPIDFSEPSKSGLRLAKTVAATHEATLDMLFVAEERMLPVFSDTGIPRLSTLKMDPEIVNDAVRGLEQLSASVGGPEVAAQGHVAEGKVPRQILRFAETHDVDLIVMATQGLAGLDRLLIGSVTQRVMRAASCPVLTLSGASHADEAVDVQATPDQAEG